MDRKQAVAALIANTTVPWTEADEPFLMGLSDERFSAFSGCADTIARNALVVGELEQQLEAAKAPEPKTEAQWLEAAPDSIKALVKKYQAQEREEHDQLVLALTEAQDVYSKEELAAMSSEQLEKLTKIAVGKKAALQDHADFSGRVPRRPDDGEAETAPPPIDMTERIKAARSA